MKDRCYRPKSFNFANYGGRGIGICDEWRESFEAFLRDMGPKPSPQHSLDRIDPDRDYEPGNARWATRLEQANNNRRSRLIAWNGTERTLSQWSRETGIKSSLIAVRLDQLGWSVERALTTPSSDYFQRGRLTQRIC